VASWRCVHARQARWRLWQSSSVSLSWFFLSLCWYLFLSLTRPSRGAWFSFIISLGGLSLLVSSLLVYLGDSSWWRIWACGLVLVIKSCPISKWLGQVPAHLTIWLLPPRETLCETLLFLLIYDSLARKPVFGIFPSFHLLWTSFTWIILSCTLATSNFDVLPREGVFEGFPELLAEISCNHPMRLSFTWSKYIVNNSAKIFCLLVEVAPALTALLTIWWFRLALSGNWVMF
jgi:hypothetical protein